MNGTGAQTHDTEGDAVRRSREATGKIKLNLTAGASAGDGGTEGLEADLRLSQSGAQNSTGGKSVGMSGHLVEVLIFDTAAINVTVEQNDSGEAYAVLRRTFHLGLTLLVDFCFRKLEVFLQPGKPLVMGGLGGSGCRRGLGASDGGRGS